MAAVITFVLLAALTAAFGYEAGTVTDRSTRAFLGLAILIVCLGTGVWTFRRV